MSQGIELIPFSVVPFGIAFFCVLWVLFHCWYSNKRRKDAEERKLRHIELEEFEASVKSIEKDQEAYIKSKRAEALELRNAEYERISNLPGETASDEYARVKLRALANDQYLQSMHYIFHGENNVDYHHWV